MFWGDVVILQKVLNIVMQETFKAFSLINWAHGWNQEEQISTSSFSRPFLWTRQSFRNIHQLQGNGQTFTQGTSLYRWLQISCRCQQCSYSEFAHLAALGRCNPSKSVKKFGGNYGPSFVRGVKVWVWMCVCVQVLVVLFPLGVGNYASSGKGVNGVKLVVEVSLVPWGTEGRRISYGLRARQDSDIRRSYSPSSYRPPDNRTYTHTYRNRSNCFSYIHRHRYRQTK